MSNKRLIKSTGVIGFATSCSRIVGFVRDILIANFFGTAVAAQAFVVSFRIPNLLRDLIGEGAANAAFVPVLTEYHATCEKQEFWELVRNVLYVLVISLSFISFCGILLAPVIVRLIAPGFVEDPQKLALTINLTRIVFPFIFLIGIVAYGTSTLNSLNHFAAPAFGPVLLNISMIFFLIFACPVIGVTGLAIGVLVGGALQIALIEFVLYRKGFRMILGSGHRLKKEIVFTHPAIKKIWKLLVPRFFGSAVYQLSVIVDNIFSSFEYIVGTGAPAALWYSYRLFHLPFAVFGIALATATLPRMSQEAVRKDISALKDTINFSIRNIFLILIPAGAGLATLGRPIIRILFERGEFTPYSTFITDNALFFYSFGLFACGGVKILINSFFSLGDTRTPVKVASASLLINLVLNFALMWPLKVGGLALATSIAAIFNFMALYILLVRRIGDVGTSRILNLLGRILIATAIMSAFSFVAGRFLDSLNKGVFVDIVGISAIMLFSIIIYVFSSLALGIDEMKWVVRWALRKD
ncbi:MAG: murein biosynthesis integral membrane protein MurJ [Omnitrophica bacterium RBG_13_46_9]|nr:MAG: murein biosynthesis integral membrane protein MurJ [Omnitrophica bacterium RBG_13_46_9]